MIVSILGVGYLGGSIAASLNDPLLVTRSLEKAWKWMNQKSPVYILKSSLAASWQALIDYSDALIITVAPSGGASYEETYLGTARHLAKALQGRDRPFHLLYCSSTAVYGEKQGAIVTEETPASPLTPSSLILIETEKILLQLASNLIKITLVRIGELWGEGRLIEDRLKKSPTLAGDGSSQTNLTHVSDAAYAFCFLLKGGHEGIFNVCSDLHLPRKQFYEQLARRYSFPSPSWDPSLPSHHSGNKAVSSNKIKALGFSFSFPGYP